ncbi:MAG: hypothetical protein IJJ99_06850 [Oscillospiraceae bacterium]|nr:hypothetical protein [Oscillospiraceae bacterium]
MFKKKKEPMRMEEVQSTWENLVKLERTLRRNQRVGRIIQPVGTIIFMFNLLLTTGNFILFLNNDFVNRFFEKVPILPSLVEPLPRGGWGSLIVFSILFTYMIPLMISAAIAGVFYYLDYKKHGNAKEPLNGSQIDKAKALTNKAETAYVLRREMPRWSVYPEAGILTGVVAVLILFAMLHFATSDSPAVLELALTCLALLLCLFVLFWVYVLLLLVFAGLNGFFCYASSEWKLYEQYQRCDAYWESVDPLEHNSRMEELRILSERRHRRKMTAEETA